MKRHPSAVRREQRAMAKSRAILNRRPFAPAADVPSPAAYTPPDDNVPALVGHRPRPRWFQVMRGVQRGHTHVADWHWETIGEAASQTDAIVLASAQRYWCVVTMGGKRVFDNRKGIKVVD